MRVEVAGPESYLFDSVVLVTETNQRERLARICGEWNTEWRGEPSWQQQQQTRHTTKTVEFEEDNAESGKLGKRHKRKRFLHLI